jgi:hypothetical protein
MMTYPSIDVAIFDCMTLSDLEGSVALCPSNPTLTLW